MCGACNSHGEVRNATVFWLRSQMGRDYSEDLGIDESLC
jgi:hypothetical protein